jgi:N-methylhydantoinase A
VPTPPLDDDPETAAESPRRGACDIYFEDRGTVESGVYWRPALAVGDVIEGPALLEGTGSTAIVPPAWTATVAPDGSVLIER